MFELEQILRLEFQSVDDVFSIPCPNREIQIGHIPLWFAPIDAFVAHNKELALDFTSSRSMKRSLTIVNKHNTALVSLVFDDNVIIVNNRYELYLDGRVVCKNGGIHQEIETNRCVIKVHNTDKIFKMRLSAKSQKYVFNVYPIGPIIVRRL